MSVRPNKPARFPSFGWWTMLLLAVMLLLIVSRYLTLDPETFFPEQRSVYQANLVWLILHIVGSMVAIVTGPFQFLANLRRGRWLNLHRLSGRIYLLGILLGGIGGLYMAFFAYGGWGTKLGFLILAVLWLHSGYRAYSHIRRKEVELHRQWMIRNYALSFAGVMLRLWQTIFGVMGLEFFVSYNLVAWLSWVPNLLFAEWLIRRNQFKAGQLRANP